MSLPLSFDYQVFVREQYIDSLGHVNNAAYLTLFEEARWELITSRGMGVAEVKANQVGPVILEIQMKFLKEIVLRETITIQTQMLDYNGKIGHIAQKMKKSDQSLAAEATFTFGIFDLKQRKLVAPSDAWKKALGII